jgi:hypothetical protein
MEFLTTGEWTQGPAGQPVGDSSFRVSVLFTGMENTYAALQEVVRLASGLEAHVLVVVPLVVPYQLSLRDSPISPDFLARKLGRVLRGTGIDFGMCVCLCRDQREAWRRALTPGSLVVIGGRRRWWPTREELLTKEVGAAGHRVMFVDVA